jgi:hypothetical protein
MLEPHIEIWRYFFNFGYWKSEKALGFSTFNFLYSYLAIDSQPNLFFNFIIKLYIYFLKTPTQGCESWTAYPMSRTGNSLNQSPPSPVPEQRYFPTFICVCQKKRKKRKHTNPN